GHHANITNVTLTNVNITGKSYVGGLVGYYMNLGSNCYIINCSVTGKVSGTRYIGGLIGYAELRNPGTTTISNSYASGVTINGIGTSNYGGLTITAAGGLIGFMLSSNNTITNITNCYAKNVDVNGSSNVGGLIGRSDTRGSSCKSDIINSYVTGEVTGTQWVGGLVGENAGDGSKAVNITSCYSNSNVTGNERVGGLVGYLMAKNGSINNIENSYSIGDISGIYTEGVSCRGAIGGIVGRNGIEGSGGTINIKNCYAAGTVKSDVLEKVGGIIGENGFVPGSTITIINCLALNKELSGTSNVGRIFGYISGDGTTKFENNYAWEGMKNGDDFFTENIGLNEINGEDVSNRSVWCNKTFFEDKLGWDFENTWEIVSADDGNCYPLPYLKTLGKDNSWRPKVIHLRPNYIVTFNKNTGDGIMDNQIFPSALLQEISPNKFLKGGYKFIGWNNSSSGAKIYDDKQPIRVTKNTTLYAVWAKITNVTLYFNNTTSSPSGSQVVNITNGFDEFNVTQLVKPIYNGHTFLGYNNSTESSSVQVINNTLKLVQNADGYTSAGKWNNTSDNVYLWAVWKPNITNVTLNFNNVSSAPNDKQIVNITYGEGQFNDTLIKPEYANHRFMGYNNSSNCGGVQVINSTLQLVPDAQGYTLAGTWVNESKDIDLWAVWARLYNITVEIPAGGNINADKVNASDGETVILTANPDEGYTFSSWIVTNATDNSPVTIIGNTFIMPKSDVNVTAIFNKIPEPSSGTSGSSTTYYGWVIYTVYFNSAGGSYIDNQTNLRYGEKIRKPENPTRDGYIFDGWYTADSYKWDFKNDIVKDTITLYAKWKLIERPLSPTVKQHHGCWIAIIILLITAAVITAVIIKKKHDKKKDEENYDVLS
ncbi:MAG TPA: InlB B-repeat-containing protein, partial [Methanocorpusculum sp.]|nr:InlB B-repeat-containing protein [Methanocorpusculum sp.]